MKWKFFFVTNLTLIIAKKHEDSPASSHKKALGLWNLAGCLVKREEKKKKSWACFRLLHNKSPLFTLSTVSFHLKVLAAGASAGEPN